MRDVVQKVKQLQYNTMYYIYIYTIWTGVDFLATETENIYWAKNWNKSKNYNFGLHFGVLLNRDRPTQF